MQKSTLGSHAPTTSLNRDRQMTPKDEVHWSAYLRAALTRLIHARGHHHALKEGWPSPEQQAHLELGGSSSSRSCGSSCLGSVGGSVGAAVHLLEQTGQGGLLLVLLRVRDPRIASCLVLPAVAGCTVAAVHCRKVLPCPQLLLLCQLLR